MTRRARVRAYAKLNLSLKVLHKRTDGYHEIRSVFQTIGIHDDIEIEYRPSKRTSLSLTGGPPIPDNLILRAATAYLERAKVTAEVQFRVTKRVPMGAGLGGGSSNAAATLLALGGLCDKPLPLNELRLLSASLGSDVPFFLHGGTALGLGRGEELYPLPDLPPLPVLLVCPQVHVSTPDAYRALGRQLTSTPELPTLDIFHSFVWRESSVSAAENDFEAVVFEQHPKLRRLRKKLEKAGGFPARMSGSGSSLFGVFPTVTELQAALPLFSQDKLKVYSTRFTTRAQYRAHWWRSLRNHVDGVAWPPRSRYEL